MSTTTETAASQPLALGRGPSEVPQADGHLHALSGRAMSGLLAIRHPRERPTPQHLRALRLSQLATALQRTGEVPRVALYVLIENRQDPADRLAVAQALAAHRGWTVIARAFDTTDTTSATDPPTRPQLARLLSEVHHGRIHAIVSASRTDISQFDDQYQQVLDQLRDRRGGLALARDETSL
ncbi:hypothetical protein [Streptomyces niveus]|uniref:hypothetical protein n=1 Tax=Streptomyces niveus TaxID=193462 RepID=UPI00342DFB1E